MKPTPMRHLIALVILCCTLRMDAQLVNNSFEASGYGTLSDWRSTCSQIDTLQDAAPGQGNWCARLPNENTQGGCWTDYLYQVLPGVQNGDPLSFDGWIKHQILFGTPASGIGIHAGHIDATGTIHFDQSALSMDTNWVQAQFSHAYTGLLPTDTAIVLLTGGYSQFTTFYGYGLFDGVQVGGLTTSIDQVALSSAVPLVYPSPCTHHLYVNGVGPFAIRDAAGKIVAQGNQSASAEPIACGQLVPGLYQIIVGERSEQRTMRFVKL